MIYMMAIRQLMSGKAAEYKEIETKLLIPGYAKYGVKMVGHWNTAIGNGNETVNIMFLMTWRNIKSSGRKRLKIR
jgi:hypothetical protein